MRRYNPGLWSNADFVKLWLGQTVSFLGQLLGDASVSIYFIAEVSLRQSLVRQRAGPYECQYAVLVTRHCSARGAARWYTWWDDWTTAHHTHRSARRDASRHMVTALTGAQSVRACKKIRQP